MYMQKDVPHKNIPTNFKKALSSSAGALELWNNITPLAKSEWICWITSAKKTETKTKRIQVGIDKLSSGMRRPCYWAGCPHRTK